MTIQDAENLLKKLADAPIKGNYPPAKHHFDSCGPISGNINAPAARFALTVPFVDNGVSHTITADCAITSFGREGGDDKIIFDGESEDHADYKQSFRTGLEGFHIYGRILLLFDFVKDGQPQHIRFDVG